MLEFEAVFHATEMIDAHGSVGTTRSTLEYKYMGIKSQREDLNEDRTLVEL